jgi:hypothetical protein
MYRAWVVVRFARWLLVPVYLAYIVAFLNNRPYYLKWNGQLAHSTEMVMFGIPILFMILGLLEMALRDQGGIPRARNFGFRPAQDLAPKTSLKR